MGKEGNDASLVLAGAKEIGQWRQQNPNKVIAAECTKAADIDLSGANLSHANLTGSLFARCNLSHVSFEGANLQGVEFDNCNLQHANFFGANLKKARITAEKLDGARFGGNRSLGRLSKLEIVNPVLLPIPIDRKGLAWYDRWIGWDRLRFLTTIKIFVPAYASLTLTVLYLNGIAWYNSLVPSLNTQISHTDGQASIAPLLTVEPTWTHALVLISFVFLTVAATCILGCPARVVEFSRERWLNELQQPELLYDHSVWQRPLIRLLCAAALLVGGLLSTFLLGRGILQQVVFILRHVG